MGGSHRGYDTSPSRRSGWRWLPNRSAKWRHICSSSLLSLWPSLLQYSQGSWLANALNERRRCSGLQHRRCGNAVLLTAGNSTLIEPGPERHSGHSGALKGKLPVRIDQENNRENAAVVHACADASLSSCSHTTRLCGSIKLKRTDFHAGQQVSSPASTLKRCHPPGARGRAAPCLRYCSATATLMPRLRRRLSFPQVPVAILTQC